MPMLATEDPITRFPLSPLQPAKALLPMLVKELGMVRPPVSPLQP